MLEQLQEIIPLPPMLCGMAGISVPGRFVVMYYSWSKATWSDGRSLSTFSFYSVWEPLTRHPAIALHLFDADLGSDDSEATHALVCDRLCEKLYLGEMPQIRQLLLSEQQPLDVSVQEQDWEQVVKEVPQRVGMLEMFGAQSPTQQLEMVSLVRWLDKLITHELLDIYFAKANAGDWRAIAVLEQLRGRLATE